jgi:serine/threonine-protein kinase
MVLPISVGTILRQRYVIQQVLGQGGFGRTYLALDQERFDEPCVIKEFMVPYQDAALVEKSKMLFQREASILYQIQHPQIPRFWAAFEDEQRLFLVQDYIQGQTYRKLLSDRKQQGKTFSEAEVIYFLRHMLPVLTYIHDRDIVHRDITPENIILRTQPAPAQSATGLAGAEPDPAVAAGIAGLPVLIDFGAVKEATSHWPLMSAATRVGKVGYAPPEQLQTGKVYPNSDLYALAATCLALLTGREPRSLLDSQTLTWRWQPYATISEELGNLLKKMLAVYPGDRFQSAREVLTTLEAGATLESTLLSSSPADIAYSAESRPALQPPPAVHKSTAPVIAYSSPSPSPVPLSHPSEMGYPQPPSKSRRGIGKGISMGIAATALIAMGVAVPVLWRTWKGNSSSNEVWVSGAKLPESEASRILESQRINSSSSALKSSPDHGFNSDGSRPDSDSSTPPSSKPAQQIQFPPNKISTVLRGNLEGNELQPYIVKGAQGQIMTASLEGEGVVMNLLRSSQVGIDDAAYRTRSWTGLLPADDQYLIQVTGSGSYSLDIAMSPPRPTQEQTQRVSFARGTSGTTVTGQIAPQQIRRYLLRAQRGQILALKVLQGAINLSAIAPDGRRIGSSTPTAKEWQERLPMDGDYVIELSAGQPEDYALSLEVF